MANCRLLAIQSGTTTNPDQSFMTLNSQLCELQLLQSSLFAGESLEFCDKPLEWQRLLDELNGGQEIESAEDLSPAHFVIKVGETPVWLDIQFSASHPNASSFSVKGNLSRDEQIKWSTLINEKMLEFGDTEYPTYEVLTSYLIPLLQRSEKILPPAPTPGTPGSGEPIFSHALMTSHHLISHHKRRDLQHWASSLSLVGFCKVGHPGVIYVQGSEDSVNEFVQNVKSLQWLALKVRFVEALGDGEPIISEVGTPWVEFEKVGKVVEYMRLIGREKYVVEMGIGSAGCP